VRRARTADVTMIKSLVDGYAGRVLLAKEIVTLYESVQEFLVAEVDGEVVGCGALHVLWADLGEIRTVAVHPGVLGRGVGHAIVAGLIENARELAHGASRSRSLERRKFQFRLVLPQPAVDSAAVQPFFHDYLQRC